MTSRLANHTMNVTPLVKDLTQGGARLAIEIDGASIYDLALTVWTVFDPDGDHSGFELGEEWFTRVATATPDDLADELRRLAGPGCSSWMALIGLFAAAPHPHDIDSALDWLSRLDPIELRRGLLLYKAHLTDPELVEAAAGGDADALGRIFGEEAEIIEHFQSLFALEPGEVRDRMVAVLRRFRKEVYSEFEAEFAAPISRAAAARRALGRGADPERVIEEVTNGLEYRIQPGTSRLVLVPSMVLRPWAVIDQHRETLVVVYPVADEFIDADPDAPPSWLVKIHKALADEKRLRILRRISEGPASLDELATLLDLTKSTTHHHVGLLRGAGLVRVSMDPATGAKVYTLRPTVLPEAQRSLDDYLRSSYPIDLVRSER